MFTDRRRTESGRRGSLNSRKGRSRPRCRDAHSSRALQGVRRASLVMISTRAAIEAMIAAPSAEYVHGTVRLCGGGSKTPLSSATSITAAHPRAVPPASPITGEQRGIGSDERAKLMVGAEGGGDREIPPPFGQPQHGDQGRRRMATAQPSSTGQPGQVDRGQAGPERFAHDRDVGPCGTGSTRTHLNGDGNATAAAGDDQAHGVACGVRGHVTAVGNEAVFWGRGIRPPPMRNIDRLMASSYSVRRG